MRPTFRKAALLGLLLTMTSVARAQFVPVVAKMKRTEIVRQNGKIIRTVSSDGAYYRPDNGSYYRQWTTVNGKKRPGETDSAGLFDNRTGILYRLDLTDHLAYQRGTVKPVKINASVYRGYAASAARNNAEGIPCASLPTRVLAPDGKSSVDVGRTCESAEYNLELIHDLTVVQPNGQKIEDRFQLYDVHVGTEPDHAIFDFRKFTLYRPSQKN